MVQYHCAKCRRLLESDGQTTGQEEPCPLCGHQNVVPVARLGSPFAKALGIGLITAILVAAIVVGLLFVFQDDDDDRSRRRRSDRIAEAPDEPSEVPATQPSDPTNAGPLVDHAGGTDQAALAEDPSAGAKPADDREGPAPGSQVATTEEVAESMENVRESARPGTERDLEGPRLSRPDLADLVDDAVFMIVMLDADGEEFATGSGFFISADGMAITNFHVLDGAYAMRAVLRNGAEYTITEALAADPDHDLALLKVPARDAPYLELRQGSPPRRGLEVMAVGSPRGHDDTITFGSISKLREVEEGWTAIQTDAAIAHGSSGGPLLTFDGKVVGVVYSLMSGDEEGFGFNLAVPVPHVHNLVANAGEPQQLANFHSSGPPWSEPMNEAYAAIQRGDYERACDMLEADVSGDSANNAAAWWLLGKARRLAGEFPASITAYRESIDLSPGAIPCYIEIAMCQVVLLRLDDTLESLNNALEKDYVSIEEWCEFSSYCSSVSGWIYSEADDPEDLPAEQEAQVETLTDYRMGAYRQAAGMTLNDLDDAYWQAFALWQLDDNDVARARLQGLVEDYPDYADAYRLLADVIVYDYDDYAEAASVTLQLLQNCPDSTLEDCTQLGDYAYQADQYELAIDAYTTVIEAKQEQGDPVAAEDWDNLALAYYWDDQDSLAVDAYREAIKLTDDPDMLANRMARLADALAFTQAYDEAIRTLNQAGEAGYPLPAYYWRAGRIYGMSGETSEARRFYNLAIEADPDGDYGQWSRESLAELE